MTLRLQNLMLAMLLALTTLFVGFGTLSQNPTSGGYQLFGRTASGISADIQLGSLGNFAPSPESASEYVNAPNTATIGGKTCVYSCEVGGVTRYVGITDDITKRGQAHMREKGIVIDQIPGLSNLSRADARAVEQTLINYHGLGKNGGTLINKINSISAVRNSTKYEQALVRGAELLKQHKYPGF